VGVNVVGEGNGSSSRARASSVFGGSIA